MFNYQNKLTSQLPLISWDILTGLPEKKIGSAAEKHYLESWLDV